MYALSTSESKHFKLTLTKINKNLFNEVKKTKHIQTIKSESRHK